MKTTINKSAKRVLSLTLAFAMLLGSLFIANVGVNITADAETAKTRVEYWDGTTLTKPETTDADGNIIINTAAELAYLAQNGGSGSYKVADNIKAIVLQPESLNGVMGLSADATKTFFETNAASAQKWVTVSDKYFSGTLNFNGATVYGMYVNSGNGGLFDTTIGGGISNVAFENCYINTTGRTGFATTYAGGSGFTVTNCAIRNNYIYAGSNAGVLIGPSAGTAVLTISNIIISDNITGWSGSSDKKIPLWRSSPAAGSTLKNAILFDVSFNYNNIADQISGYTNVYTSHTGDPVDSEADVVTPISKGQLTGVAGMLYLTDEFNWGTDWYAVEGELPSPIKPANYVPLEMPEVWDPTVTAADFAADKDGKKGDGTKENPHLIETPAQLYKAVTDKSTLDDNKTPIYYKVKDGVKALYLSGSQNWSATQLADPFKGNFDGNGVKIIGMYSEGEQVGLFQWLGLGAVVKNITFDGCTVKGTGATGAMLANKLTKRTDTTEGTLYTGLSSTTYGSVLVHNVAVINSSVTATSYAAGLVAYAEVPDSIQFNNCLFDGATTTLSATNIMGIYGTAVWYDNYEIHNSVSIGAYIAPNRDANAATPRYYNDYSNYTNDGGERMTAPTFIRNSYSIDTNGTNLDISGCRTDSAVNFDAVKADFVAGLPQLDWASGWTVATVGGREIPMPTVRTAADSLGIDNEGRAVLDWGTALGAYGDAGASYQGGSYMKGTYGHFNQFKGLGTYESPYLIYDAVDLARAIGCGGVNYGEKLYFMLANDIDLSGFQWLSTVGFNRIDNNAVHFKYVPFEGTLNGDGYTITGLYAAAHVNETSSTGDSQHAGAAALIPVFNGGTVKKLHIRNSHAGTDDPNNRGAGAIFGKIHTKITVEGCSIEDTTVVGITGRINDEATITMKNTYYTMGENYMYYGNEGTIILSNPTNGTDPVGSLENFDYSVKDADGKAIWYCGGAEGSMPQLINHADAMPYSDICGDGYAYDLDNNDVTALQNKILRKPAYANVYGDVNNDGRINILDLVLLMREHVFDYQDIEDGFWRNLEVGNVTIYYGENDNYDAARKMEIYLEKLYDIDVQKNIVTTTETTVHPYDGRNAPDGAGDGKYDIIIGNIADTYKSDVAANSYKATYDAEKATLWIQGGSFTAVDYAVETWIAQVYADPTALDLAEGTIPAYKNYVELDGDKYYYAWGDEFGYVDTNKDGVGDQKTAYNPNSLNRSNWINTVAHSGGSTDEDNKASAMKDLRSGAAPTIEALTEVKDGKLIIKRGYLKDSTISGEEQTADVSLNGMVGLTAEQAISATNSGTNDRFYSAGSFSTDNLMLFKEGYIEFRAAVPAEGHAFPALWLHSMGSANIHSNASWSASLYGKIFKLNDAANNAYYPWNDQDTIVFPTTASDLATFKYQIPSLAYEIDIFELMQNPQTINRSDDGNYGYPAETDTARDWRTAVGIYKDKPTMHRWYRNGINAAGTYYDRDFITGTISGAVTSSPTNTAIATDDIDFGTYKVSAQNNISGGDISVISGDPKKGTNPQAYAAITAMRRYGFLWNADKDSGAFTFKVIVYDVNGDGDESDTESITFTSENSEITTDDAKRMAEMYMYILIDNEFYTHNDQFKTDVTDYEYTDILTAGGADATHMEIDYVRVYQLDGKRDIVTAETEAFNNGNHFGY